jgi:hypothetical protein
VSEILRDHVTLETEGIDRMYLNVYVPQLQCESNIDYFFRRHRGLPGASPKFMAPMTRSFVKEIEDFAAAHKLPIEPFEKGQRKDDVTLRFLRKFRKEEGVLYVGKAQEKAPLYRIRTQINPKTGKPYPWLFRSTAMVNHYYFYCVDQDFGPFFLKFCSYFPYNAKLCINGHEYAKRQLKKEGIRFEALDNGILRCADPKRLQKICDGLSVAKIDDLLRKWLERLPHPFTPPDRKAGFRYDLSILQAEFSLTQVLDRPLTGRYFFEQVIRENLDIGRPDRAQLVFERRVTKSTPGFFRTRVLTQGVTPSLHFEYKRTHIKQYHKEGQALRTETTIQNTRDFGIGKRLINLPALREIGFQANRRLLDVQRISHDCAIGEDAIKQVDQPVSVQGQRASALRFLDARVQILFHALVLFRLLPRGFSNKTLREHVALLSGQDPGSLSQGRMTYDLRRLRLHGLIHRVPKTHRYEVTAFGLRAALFMSRSHARLLRPGLAQIMSKNSASPASLQRHFDALENAMNAYVQQEKLAA